MMKRFFYSGSFIIEIEIELISDIVFVDVRDIIDGFPSDEFIGNFFDIEKPFCLTNPRQIAALLHFCSKRQFHRLWGYMAV